MMMAVSLQHCRRLSHVRKVDPEDEVNQNPDLRREEDEWSLRAVAIPIKGLLQTLKG